MRKGYHLSIKGIQKGCTAQAMGIKNKTQKQKQTNKQTKNYIQKNST